MKSLVAYSSVVHIGTVSLGGLSGLELTVGVLWYTCWAFTDFSFNIFLSE